MRHCSRISEPMKPVAPVRTIFTIFGGGSGDACSSCGVGGEFKVGGGSEERSTYLLEARKLVELTARRDVGNGM